MEAITRDELVDHVRVELKEVAPEIDVQAIPAGAHIADVGIDSMQMLELVARLEERLGIRLPDYELTAIDTIDDLVAVVGRHAAAER